MKELKQTGWLLLFLCLGLFVGLVLGNLHNSEYKTLYSEPPKNLLCQPFKSEKQMESERQQLVANGYRLLLYQDLEYAYRQRSQGKGEIIEQSNHQCFDRGFVTQHWLANELWFKEVK